MTLTQFSDLPNEILDLIFSFVTDTSTLYPLLFSQKLHASAKAAIYKHDGPAITGYLPHNGKFESLREFSWKCLGNSGWRDGLDRLPNMLEHIKAPIESLEFHKPTFCGSKRVHNLGMLPLLNKISLSSCFASEAIKDILRQPNIETIEFWVYGKNRDLLEFPLIVYEEIHKHGNSSADQTQLPQGKTIFIRPDRNLLAPKDCYKQWMGLQRAFDEIEPQGFPQQMGFEFWRLVWFD